MLVSGPSLVCKHRKGSFAFSYALVAPRPCAMPALWGHFRIASAGNDKDQPGRSNCTVSHVPAWGPGGGGWFPQVRQPQEGEGPGQEACCVVCVFRVRCCCLRCRVGQFEAIRTTGRLKMRPCWRKRRWDRIFVARAEMEPVLEPSVGSCWKGSDGRVERTRPGR